MEEIKLQVALINPLMNVKGHAAPESMAAVARAHLLIEQAEALGERPEDSLLLFSVLYGFWVVNYVAFSGATLCDLAGQFLALAERQSDVAPRLIGHRLMAITLMHIGDVVQGRAHFDKAISLYDPAEHRSLATRFGHDSRMAALCFRSWALWMLGYPDAALLDAEQGIQEAREVGQAASLMYALYVTSFTHIFCGKYPAARLIIDELAALADEMRSPFWRAGGHFVQGWLVGLTGEPSDALQLLNSGFIAMESTGATVFSPFASLHIASVQAKLGLFDDARRSIEGATTAMETTRETWFEAEVHRLAGEIALMSPVADVARAQAYFERALTVARQQQAKSWELRASMSLAHLWRSQGKVQQARELLAPVYEWFTEGFDTRDLKEAKALLERLV
jgi:predicted ATPase